MRDIASRVAHRFIAVYRVADDSEVEEKPKAKPKGPPPRWKEWLDEAHQGGHQSVPNPNHDSPHKTVLYGFAQERWLDR